MTSDKVSLPKPLQAVHRPTFVWTTKQEASTHEQRTEQSQVNSKQLPAFCMETAMTLLYWAGLAYECKEVNLAGSQEKWEAQLAWGFQLADVEHFDVLVEPRSDVAALLAWGKGGIVIAFRGTASWQNIRHDLKAWMTLYDTGASSQLGMHGRSCLHAGFHKCWTDNGFDARLLDRCMGLSAEWQAAHPGQPVPIHMTGHSLGGAIAQLAAGELALKAEREGQDVASACYTYGAPRVGNHAFASAYRRLVPNTFNVMNMGDWIAENANPSPRFKHAGRRVFITASGHIVYTAAESNLWRALTYSTYSDMRWFLMTGGARHHLVQYERALMIACASKCAGRDCKALHGLLDLSKASAPMTALFNLQLGLHPAKQEQIRGALCQMEKAGQVQAARSRLVSPLYFSRKPWKELAATFGLARAEFDAKCISYESHRSSIDMYFLVRAVSLHFF